MMTTNFMFYAGTIIRFRIYYSTLLSNNAGEIEMELGNTTRMGYPIMARMSPQYEDYFEIFLSEVPSDICKLLLQSQWQSPYSIFVGIEEYEATPDICNSAEKVELAYEFYKDMRGKEEVPEDSRHQIDRCRHDNDCRCGTCSDGLCKSYCENEDVCVLNYSDPKHFVCCNPENTANGVCCVNQVSDGECCDENLNCCPAEKPLRDKDGNCYTCDEASAVRVDDNPDSCYACPNRILRIAGYGAKYCAMPCGVKGTENENKPLLDIFGKCHACDEEINFVVMNSADCNQCTGRFATPRFDGGYWCSICGVAGTKYADMPLLHYQGTKTCYACDTPDTVPQHSIESAYKCKSVCPNRLVNGANCLPGCPADKPLKSAEDNQCYDCNYTGKVLTSGVSGGECSTVCTNRQAVMTQYNVEYCQLKTCPADKPLLDYFGACHSCDEEINFVVKNKEDCNKCSGRFATPRFDGGYWCSICGVAGTKYADMPLLHYQGTKTCYACNTPDTVPQHSIGSEYKCQNVCSNRQLNGNNCIRISCTGDKKLLGADDQCYECNISSPINVNGDKDRCAVCVNRHIDGLYCVLN